MAFQSKADKWVGSGRGRNFGRV